MDKVPFHNSMGKIVTDEARISEEVKAKIVSAKP